VYNVYTYSQRRKGEGGEGELTREKARGATVHKTGSDKHLPQSPFTGQFFCITTFGFGVYIVNKKSMGSASFLYTLYSYIKINKCLDKFLRMGLFAVKS
jgi:hypothetical protein